MINIHTKRLYTNLFSPLPKKKYRIIYVDPPWDYGGQLQHCGKGGGDTGGSIRHYSSIKLEDLKRLDVLSIADNDCLLFLWATSPHLDQAIDLGKLWGFQWATVGFVWDKRIPNPGHYTMSQVELCLIFKRGRIPRPRGARNIKQLVSECKREHSRKPDSIRRLIDAMFPVQKKIEIFARRNVAGWDGWGNEPQIREIEA